jgi:thymidylate synthase (FAD)
MTNRTEVQDDPNYKSMLDHGFIGLVEHMGSDDTIVQSARVSYGKGTKKVSENRTLIRYLLKHQHTTPFEMAELRFHCKMPLFVARQWIRHRTANVNEYSARYSELSNEFYIPELYNIEPQSTTNNQGREDGGLSDHDKEMARNVIDFNNTQSYANYQILLGNEEFQNDPAFSTGDNMEGISRELARMVIPVNVYTEWYWKCDLWNIMHFLQLRLDPHAQLEIRVYAEAMYEMIKPLFPLAIEAFDDYIRHSVKLSRMEYDILSTALSFGDLDILQDDDALETTFGLSKREIVEFKARWKIPS